MVTGVGDAAFMYNFPHWHLLNQQSFASNCRHSQTCKRKYRRKRKKQRCCFSSDFQSKTACHTILALSLFLVLIIVIAIAALAIYIGMEIILDGSIRITYGDYYAEELYNRTSQLFLTKAYTYKIMIEKLFAQSVLGPAVKQCIVMGFKNGSLIVFYRLILDRRKIPSRIFSNLEETAKKILYEEITTLKPFIFDNIKVDPKEIVLKKHVSNIDYHLEKGTNEKTAPAEISGSDIELKHGIVFTTPSLIRRKSPTSAATTFAVANTNSSYTAITKNNKKHRQSIAEKSNRLKLQLGRFKPKNESSINISSHTKSEIRDVKKSPPSNKNAHSNFYSFVSDEELQSPAQIIAKTNTSNNESKLQGIGEARVIVVPPTSAEIDYYEEDYAEREKLTNTDPADIYDKSYLTRQNNQNGSKNLNASTFDFHDSNRINSSVHHLNKQVEQNHNIISSSESAIVNLSMPTRSNIALNKTYRPKPTPATGKNSDATKAITINQTVIKEAVEDELAQTTETDVIILNTEVVTSTSLQISFGQHELIDEKLENLDSVTDESPHISHNVQSVAQIAGNNVQKYRKIFPRSIHFENENLLFNETFDSRATKVNVSNSLNTLIEIYKKRPTNETLQYLIEQVAAMYTKATTPIYTTPEPHTFTQNHNTFLLTRPMNKFQMFPANQPIKLVSPGCQNNNTKFCENGQCIPDYLWCNQFVDCEDKSDEKNCTCADYLRTQFSTNKICDGIVDCWDYSDETQCDWCAPGMYVCTNAQLCIQQNQLCDGNRDCPLGDDEKSCISVIPSIQQKNEITLPSSGIIAVKRNGAWGKLCFEKAGGNFTVENKLSELGKAICKTMTFKNFVNIQVETNTEVIKKQEPSPMYYKLTRVHKNITDSFRKKNFKFVRTDCDSKEVTRVTCDSLECGIQTQISRSKAYGKYVSGRKSRIVGGKSATYGAWPWQAALYKEGEYQCGATLISSKWLLSAAHCFNNGLKDYWVARLGILRRSSIFPTPYEQIRPIRNIIVHPNYTDIGFINDISILEMDSEVSLTNFVRPICLPNPNTILQDGTLCTVIGWGQLVENGSVYPDTLQEVQLPVISAVECQKRTVFLPLYKITDDMLCAGFDRGGRDACLGDSGGPLMCQHKNGVWSLYGITSNGNGCARANRPGIYSKVINYLDWIENSINHSTKLNTTIKAVPSCNGHRCPLGECLPKARICNGYLECRDGSDEIDCQNTRR